MKHLFVKIVDDHVSLGESSLGSDVIIIHVKLHLTLHQTQVTTEGAAEESLVQVLICLDTVHQTLHLNTTGNPLHLIL